MPEAVYRMLTLLCALVRALPIGTNLGLLHLLWMLVSGQLLAARGAVLPGLSACGLSDRAIRRAWAALGQGNWTSRQLLARWAATVVGEGHWQPHAHGGYHPVGVDVTGFWRPRLRTCPTTHYHGEAGKALPAIPVGLIVRRRGCGGHAGGVARGDGDPSPRPRAAAGGRGGAAVRGRRRAGAGCRSAWRPQTSGASRTRGGRSTSGGHCPIRGGRGRPPRLPATPSPPRRRTAARPGRKAAPCCARKSGRTWSCPRPRRTPRPSRWSPETRSPRALLLASPLPVTPPELRARYRDRWPVEQLPLAAKQMVGPLASSSMRPRPASACPSWPCWPGAFPAAAATARQSHRRDAATRPRAPEPRGHPRDPPARTAQKRPHRPPPTGGATPPRAPRTHRRPTPKPPELAKTRVLTDPKYHWDYSLLPLEVGQPARRAASYAESLQHQATRCPAPGSAYFPSASGYAGVARATVDTVPGASLE